MKVALGMLHQTVGAIDSHTWWCMAAALYMPLLYILIGRKCFIHNFGASSLGIRLVLAVRWIASAQPAACGQTITPLWRSRLLLIHATAVLQCLPCSWYWISGFCNLTAITILDVADPLGTCSASLVCLVTGLQARAATPVTLLHAILQAALHSSKEAAVGIVLPGLLLAWLEARACRVSLRQQQQHQAAAAAPAACVPTLTAVCSQQGPEQDNKDDCQVAAALSACSFDALCSTDRHRTASSSSHSSSRGSNNCYSSGVKPTQQQQQQPVQPMAGKALEAAKAVHTALQQTQPAKPMVTVGRAKTEKAAGAALQRANSLVSLIQPQTQSSSFATVAVAQQNAKFTKQRVAADEVDPVCLAPAQMCPRKQQQDESQPAMAQQHTNVTKQQQVEAVKPETGTDSSFDGTVSIINAEQPPLDHRPNEHGVIKCSNYRGQQLTGCAKSTVIAGSMTNSTAEKNDSITSQRPPTSNTAITSMVTQQALGFSIAWRIWLRVAAAATAGKSASANKRSVPIGAGGTSGIHAQPADAPACASSTDQSLEASNCTKCQTASASGRHWQQNTIATTVRSAAHAQSTDRKQAQLAAAATTSTSAVSAIEDNAQAAPAAGAAVLLQQQLQQQRHPGKVSALYCSPLHHMTVSFKFAEYPDNGLAPVLLRTTGCCSSDTLQHSRLTSSKFDLVYQTMAAGLVAVIRFQQQLAAAVEKAAMSAPTGTPSPAANTANFQPALAAWVTSTAAFPGCFQVVLQLAAPSGQLLNDTQHVEKLLQELQHAAEQMVGVWPLCEGLVGVQLQGLPEPQHLTSLEEGNAAALTAGPDSSTVLAASQLQPVWQAAAGTENPPTVAAAVLTGNSSSFAALLGQLRACYGPSCGMSIHPIALPLPCPNPSATAATAATATSTSSFLAVQLHIPGSVVQKLTAANQHSVRILVASQEPAGQPLLDGTHQLHPDYHSHAAGAHNTGMAAADTVSAPCHVTAATATAAQPADVHLQLHVPLAALLAATDRPQQLRKLTVLVLAGQTTGSAVSHPGSTSSTAAPTAVKLAVHADAIDSQIRNRLEQQGIGADAASLHGVMAILPLLVLPAAAAAEVQDLFATTAAACACDSTAFAQLLPLLRDFGTALSPSPASSVEGISSLSTVRQSAGMQPPVLLQSLSVFFQQRGMCESNQLLHTVCNTEASISDDQVLRCKTGSSQGQPQVEADTGTDNSINTPDGHIGSGSSTCIGTEPAHSTTSSTADSNSGCINTTHDADDDSCQPSCGNHASATSATLSGVQQPELLYLETVHFGILSVLFGFKSAAAEAAYLHYKAAALHLLDFVVMTSMFVAMLSPLLHLLMLLGRGYACHNYDVDTILESTLRMLAFGITSAAHGVVWVAGTGVGGLGRLRLWRSAILFVGIITLLCITAFCQWYGSALARASTVAVHSFCYTRWPIPLHRDLIYLVFVCAEVLPYTVIYLLLQFLMFNPATARPAVFGLGAAHSAALLVCAHQVLAIAAEANMRRRFVRRVRQAARTV